MVTRSLPESCSCLTPLYRGELFAIDDWRCAGQDTGHAEEWSADDRVVVTRRGLWELVIAGEARYADTLTATCWNRHAQYRVRHPIGGGDHCTVFRLSEAGRRELRALAQRRDDLPTFATRTRAMDGETYLLHRTALERARPGAGRTDALAIEEPALAFLRAMLADHDPRDEPDRIARANHFVADTRDIIARDFRQPLSLERIAREVQCSPFHLSRLFQRGTGNTIHRAVMQHRLRAGLERLLDEPTNVASIALDVGFASHSHFTDAFRAEFGCSPREARGMVCRSEVF
jgi:AraC family transcriptional regulator